MGSHLQEYTRFLVLKAKEAAVPAVYSRLAPSPTIDSIWHTHILEVGSYYWVCIDFLGLESPILHSASPNLHMYDDRIEHTRRRYLEVFGEEPPAKLWPNLTSK